MPDPLVPLPAQPAGVPWPTVDWPEGGPLPTAAAAAMDEMFEDTATYERTFAVLVVQGGRLMAERYAGELDRWDRPNEPVDRTTRLLSWSMTKSFLHAAVGIAMDDGLLALHEPAPVPEWADPADPRHAITLEHLLTMRDGLDFREDYLDGQTSHVIDMLFGEGQGDVAGYAARRPLAAPPGTRYSYSSGTSNIVARILGDALGGEDATRAFLRDRLFRPIGMPDAEPRFDAAGTFVGSSYLLAPARQLAKLGLLYLRDGSWDGARLLPQGWVDHARRQRSWDRVDDVGHGAHWWTTEDERGTFRAAGYEGQMIVVCPAHDLLVARLGKTDAAHKPDLATWRDRMVAAFD